jgi:hypothetical protein
VKGDAHTTAMTKQRREQPRPAVTPVLLTREQAADIAQVSPDRIDDWSYRAGFPVIRDAHLVRIHADEFVAWLRMEALRTNARTEPTQIVPELPKLPALKKGAARK